MNFVSLYPIECEQTELKNMENPFEEQQNKLQRPTFLLVLCILTFIGSGWGTLSNLFSVFTAGLTDSSMQMEHYSSMLNSMDQGAGSAVFSDILNSTMASLQATFVHAKEIGVECDQFAGGNPDVSITPSRFLSLYGSSDSGSFCIALFCRILDVCPDCDVLFGPYISSIYYLICCQFEIYDSLIMSRFDASISPLNGSLEGIYNLFR